MDIVLTILNWILIGTGGLFAFGYAAAVRRSESLMPGTAAMAMFFMAGWLFIVLSGASPLHLLWIFPMSFVISFLVTLGLPIIPWLALLYFRLCKIGK